MRGYGFSQVLCPSNLTIGYPYRFDTKGSTGFVFLLLSSTTTEPTFIFTFHPPLSCRSSVSSAHDTFPPFCTTRTRNITAAMIGTFFLSPYTLLLLPIIYYLLPYIRNNAIRDIPGPTPAIFSNLWLLYQCRRGRRYLAVDQAHKRFGPLARIQPDHVSIADPEAIPVVYSHTGGWLKR